MFDFSLISDKAGKHQGTSLNAGLVAAGIAFARGGRAATPHLDLPLQAGSATFLLGANGAGKTSMLLGLAGFLPPLFLPENDETNAPMRDSQSPSAGGATAQKKTRHQAGESPEIRDKSSPDLAKKSLAHPPSPHPPQKTRTGRFGQENESLDSLVGALQKAPPLLLQDKQTFPRGLKVKNILLLQAVLAGAGAQAKSSATSAGNFFALPHNSEACRLSAGQQRRLALAPLFFARTLGSAPALWLLDEPFAHLDQQATRLIAGLIAQQLHQGGVVVLAQPAPQPTPVGLYSPAGAGGGEYTTGKQALSTMLAPPAYFEPPNQPLSGFTALREQGAGEYTTGKQALSTMLAPPAYFESRFETKGVAIEKQTKTNNPTTSGQKFRALLGADLVAGWHASATLAATLFIVAAGFLFGLAGGGVRFAPAPANSLSDSAAQEAQGLIFAPAILSVLCLLAVCLTLETPWRRSPLGLATLLLNLPHATLALLRTTTHFFLIFPPLALGVAIVFFLLSLPLSALPATLGGLAVVSLTLASLACMTACLLVSARSDGLLLGFVFLPLAVVPLLSLASLLEAVLLPAAAPLSLGSAFALALGLAGLFIPTCLAAAVLALKGAVS